MCRKRNINQSINDIEHTNRGEADNIARKKNKKYTRQNEQPSYHNITKSGAQLTQQNQRVISSAQRG